MVLDAQLIALQKVRSIGSKSTFIHIAILAGLLLGRYCRSKRPLECCSRAIAGLHNWRSKEAQPFFTTFYFKNWVQGGALLLAYLALI